MELDAMDGIIQCSLCKGRGFLYHDEIVYDEHYDELKGEDYEVGDDE